MTDVTAQVRKTLPAPVADVWAALTDAAKMKQFFYGADVDTDFKVGSPISMRGEFNGNPYHDQGTILSAQPNRQLSFSHWSASSGKPDTAENQHVVTFDLDGHGAQTEVTLSQSNRVGGVKPSDIAHRADYEKNWTGVLEALATLFRTETERSAR